VLESLKGGPDATTPAEHAVIENTWP
jgi:hypothetical protein